MKTTLKVLLFVSVFVMGYLCVMSILRPIQFDGQRKKREKAVINRLIDIRTAQIAFCGINGHYAPNFDTLISFLNNGKIPYLIKKGSLTDEQLEAGMTEEKAKKEGIIVRDTIFKIAKDTLFSPSYKADSICFVPGTSEKFYLSASDIPTSSGIFIPVFECSTPMETYLKGLNRQEIVNLKETAEDLGKFPGLMVGSTKEINNNAGNWE